MSLFSDTVIAITPSVRTDLRVSEHAAQQLVSLFAFSAALASLGIGALADAYGRDPMVP